MDTKAKLFTADILTDYSLIKMWNSVAHPIKVKHAALPPHSGFYKQLPEPAWQHLLFVLAI